MHDKKYTSDAILKRGYAIYDEWCRYKFASRSIVNAVERAVGLMRKKKTIASCYEALAYVFALDMRIKEKYKSFFYCILSYFSWRRETRALKTCKFELNISQSEDIRTAIEIEIERIREKLKSQGLYDDDDDESGGGKRTDFYNDNSIASADKQQGEFMDNSQEELVDLEDNEEISEEIIDTTTDESQFEEHNLETDKNQDVLYIPQERDDSAAEKENEEQENDNLNEENNGEEISESINDKDNEIKNSNDIIYSSQQNASLLNNNQNGEVPLDNNDISEDLINGNEEIHTSSEKTQQGKTVNDKFAELLLHKDNRLENNDTKKENLNDKSSLEENGERNELSQQSEKGNIQQIENKSTPTQQTQQVQQTQQSSQQIQNNVTDKDIRDSFDDLRVPIQIDLDQENKMRMELNNTMTDEMKMAYIERQKEVMREQLIIASAEFGIDAPVEIIGRLDTEEINQPIIASTENNKRR